MGKHSWEDSLRIFNYVKFITVPEINKGNVNTYCQDQNQTMGENEGVIACILFINWGKKNERAFKLMNQVIEDNYQHLFEKNHFRQNQKLKRI